MKTLPFGLLLALTTLAFAVEPAPAQPAETVKVAPKAKAKAPDPAMTPIKDVAGLPRILLIGDSISIGLPTARSISRSGSARTSGMSSTSTSGCTT